MEGTVKVLMNGFGFITSEETEKDTFFHANDLDGIDFNTLSVGDTLTFEIGEGNNGKTQAVNVALV
jgi:cold shock CspA family protein